MFDSRLSRWIRSYLTRPLEESGDRSQLLLGRLACWQVRPIETVSSLEQVEFKVFSQWGEDGIIDWLVERAEIPAHLHTFVEFGVESYVEANTRFLLQNRNWRGLVMDGSANLVEQLKRNQRLFWAHDLSAKAAFITRENINDLIVEGGLSGEIGLLSIDIDGNDYWVWESISAVRPVLCICEYNAVFGDMWPISIPYERNFVRTRPEYRNLYFGASITALRLLGKRKGYTFLGTNSAGVNAFFVRDDYARRFESAIANAAVFPSKLRESMEESRRLSFRRGSARADLMEHLPVVNTETQERHTLRDLKPLYSDEWMQILELPRLAKPAELISNANRDLA